MTDTFTAIAATQGVNTFAAERNLPLPETGARAIIEVMNEQKKAFPKGSVHPNMTSNSELNSREGTEFDRYGDAAQAFAVLTYTLPGLPMIYTGQEAGADHSFSLTAPDSVPDYGMNPHIRQLYTQLNKLRREHRALWQGAGKEPSFKQIQTSSPDIIAFEREKDNDRILVVANLSNSVQPLKFSGRAPNLTNMRNHLFRFVREFPAELQPWEVHIYRPTLKLPRLKFIPRLSYVNIGDYFSNPVTQRMAKQNAEEKKKVEEENERRQQLEWEDE